MERDKQLFPKDKYNLNKNSLFLDIGSGFGKPVIHTAFQCNCECLGIEVVPARTEFCLDFYYEYLCNSNIFSDPDFIKDEKLNNNSTSASNVSLIEEKKLEKIKLFNAPAGMIESILLENPGFLESMINKNFTKDDNFSSFFQNKPQSVSVDTFNQKFDEYFELKEIEIEKDVLHYNPEDNLISEEILKSINRIENQKILDFFIFKNEFVDFVKEIPVKLSIENKFEPTINLTKVKSNDSGGTGSSKTGSKHKKKKSKKDQVKQKKLNLMENSESQEEIGFPDNVSSGIQEENISSIGYSTNISNSDIKTYLTLNKFTYDDNWWSKISFECQDATKFKSYSNEKNEHYTHIYSYNKIMGEECSSRIAKILNKTNFAVLAWYLTPKQSEKAGLKNVLYLCSIPMHTTSTEKFNVYIYIKTR
jgi:hypothetical protein